MDVGEERIRADDDADGELRMVAIFRADLLMHSGKPDAQAGHAFVSALLSAESGVRERHMLCDQPRIVPAADPSAPEKARTKAEKRGIASFIVVEAGTALPEPTATVPGTGPMTRTDSNAVTRNTEMMA